MIKMTRLKGPLTLALGLTAALVLAACGQTASPAAAPPATQGNATTSAATTSPASAAPSTSAGRRINITVKGKQITPAPATVPLAVGESLTVVLTSDHDDQLHAHGFNNLEENVKADTPLEVKVTGAETGVFEFELHHPELLLFKVAVR